MRLYKSQFRLFWSSQSNISTSYDDHFGDYADDIDTSQAACSHKESFLNSESIERSDKKIDDGSCRDTVPVKFVTARGTSDLDICCIKSLSEWRSYVGWTEHVKIESSYVGEKSCSSVKARPKSSKS